MLALQRLQSQIKLTRNTGNTQYRFNITKLTLFLSVPRRGSGANGEPRGDQRRQKRAPVVFARSASLGGKGGTGWRAEGTATTVDQRRRFVGADEGAAIWRRPAGSLPAGPWSGLRTVGVGNERLR